MFKLESYVTPYILAYLGKYFKNFDPADFQMSLWGGGALFQNLNLDLQVLDEELNLPVSFMSGHIHGLKITVPWTKVTSEPIQVHVNTIEVTLRLKRLDGVVLPASSSEDTTTPATVVSPGLTPLPEQQPPPPPTPSAPPSGYMQGLIAKILNNVHVTFENVIVKYIEEDIVLSLNIKKATYATVDENWEGAFVDLTAPDFILRKKFQFQDLTICLDQANTTGLIETYQEPFLYRCAFEIRIFQMFKSAFSKTAAFTRMDFHFDHMLFSITDEQVPMLIRLYVLLQSLLQVPLTSVPLTTSSGRRRRRSRPRGLKRQSLQQNVFPFRSQNSAQRQSNEEEASSSSSSSAPGWTAWAMSWLPPISTFLGDEYEDGDVVEEDSSSTSLAHSSSSSSHLLLLSSPQSNENEEDFEYYDDEDEDHPSRRVYHYGFFVNEIDVKFKALERPMRPPLKTGGRPGRVKFIPFMNLHFQGVIADIVFRGDEANHQMGASYCCLIPLGFCPCGIVDGDACHKESSEGSSVDGDAAATTTTPPPPPEDAEPPPPPPPINQYLTVGERNPDYAKDSMFLVTDGFGSNFNYNFQLDRHVENYEIDAMLQRTPAIAIDYLYARRPIEPGDATDYVDLARTKLLVRMVVSPSTLSVSSGLLHRLKLISYAIDNYSYEPYGEIHRLLSPRSGSPSPLPGGQLDYATPRLATTAPLDYTLYRHASAGTDSYEVTILSPSVQLWAADHPEYDFESREAHLRQRRRIRTTTPFSQVMPNWPKLVISAEQVFLTRTDPNTRVRALVARAIEGNISTPRLPRDVLLTLKRARNMQVGKVRLELTMGAEEVTEIVSPSSFSLSQKTMDRRDVFAEDDFTLTEESFSSDSFHMSTSFIELTLCHIIVTSTLQNIERYSEHLTTSTLLADLASSSSSEHHPSHRSSRLSITTTGLAWSHAETKTYSSHRAVLSRIAVLLDEETPLFIAPINNETTFLLALAQYPRTDHVEEVHVAPHVGIVHRIRPSSPLPPLLCPVLVVHVAPWKATLTNGIFTWMQYSPRIVPSMITQEVRMAREIKVPLRPNSCNSSSRGGDTSSRKSFGRHSDIAEELRGASSSRPSGGSTTSSSLPGYQVTRHQPLLPNQPTTTTTERREDGGADWMEAYITTFLAHLKNAKLSISVSFGEVWFPVGGEKCVVFVTPRITRPRGAKTTETSGDSVEWGSVELPVKLTSGVHATTLPINLSLEDMYFATTTTSPSISLESDLCCPKFSASVGLTLFKRREDNEATLTTIHVSCDVDNIAVSLSEEHIATLTKLLDQVLLSCTLFPSVLPIFPRIPPDDFNTPGDLLSDETKSERSAHSTAPPRHTGRPHSSSDLDNFSISSEPQPPPQARGPPLHVPMTTCFTLLTNISSLSVSITSSSSSSKLTLDLTELVTSLTLRDVYFKLSHKTGHFRVLNFIPDPALGWKPGPCLGVILTSGDDLTRDISPMEDSFNKPKEGELFTARISNPSVTPPPHKKTISSTSESPALSVNYTRVLASNCHAKAGLTTSPYAKWISTLDKFAITSAVLGSVTDLAPVDEESDRFLAEIDVSVRTVDVVFNPGVFSGFKDMVDGFLDVVGKKRGEEEEVVVGNVIPALNNNTVPLFYLVTENIRLFVQGVTKNNRDRYKSHLPDFFLLECSGIRVDSHNDYPLNRTLISPLLFHLGQKARILEIPGSPVEDRQYQVVLSGVSASTGFFAEVAAKSSKHVVRSSLQLKTQGENPALEWNIRTMDTTGPDVATCPLLAPLDVTLALAPAMVYTRDVTSPSAFSSHLIAGHAAQLNLLSDVKINLNVDQIESWKQIGDQIESLVGVNKKEATATTTTNSSARRDEDGDDDGISSASVMGLSRSMDVVFIESSQEGSLDSGLSHTVKLVPSSVETLFKKQPTCSPRTTRSDVSISISKTTTNNKSAPSLTPFDFLLSSGIIHVTVYDLQYNVANAVEKVLPLVSMVAMQPHVVLSVSQHCQKFEVSLFELSVKLGAEEIDSTWIPSRSHFPHRLFESIRGVRDVKTGIVPPLLNLKITDFISHPCTILCDIRRPIRVEMGHAKLANLLRILPYLLDSGAALHRTDATVKLIHAAELVEQNRRYQTDLRRLLGQVGSASFTASQLVLVLVEEPAAITLSIGSARVNATVQRKPATTATTTASTTTMATTTTGIEAENVAAVIVVESVTVSSRLRERTSPVVTAFNTSLDVKSGWSSGLDYPITTMNVQLDPISLFLGPQNILCVQQIYAVFQEYLDEITLVEEEIIDIMEHYEPTGSKMICDSYEDDLRSGSFHLVRHPVNYALPRPYEILCSQKARTLTWRYPQHRVLTGVQATPVPLPDRGMDTTTTPPPAATSSSSGTSMPPPASPEVVELDCVVEYWDEAMCDFRHFGALTLSQVAGARCTTPARDKLHIYHAAVWRIKILTAVKDSDCSEPVRPEILAACVKVDSIHDSSLTSRLKVFLEVPRINLHFVNNFFFSGQGPSSLLPAYNRHSSSLSSSQCDQTFATLCLESNSMLLSIWAKHATVDVNAFVDLHVLDTEFLTMARVLSPALLSTSLSLFEAPHSNKVHSEVEVFWREVEVRVGASTLHTLSTAGTVWTQLLTAWDGRRIQIGDKDKMETVNVSAVLVLNTLSTELRFHQCTSDTSLFIPPGSVAPFYWATTRSKPVCKLAVKLVTDAKNWTFSAPFDLKQNGTLVRRVGSSQHNLFLQIAPFSGMQRVITVSGGLLTCNALAKRIQVAVLPSNKSVESGWTLAPGGGYGSTQLFNLGEIDHFRFRILVDEEHGMGGQQQPWSGIVTPDQLRAKKRVPLSLFEEIDGALVTFCVWVSLITEMLEEATVERALVVLCPYFRVQSFLPTSTWVNVSPKQVGSPRSLVGDCLLPGMGQELEIPFTQGHNVAHHLTLQTSLTSSASTPSIPLLPEGPVLTMPPNNPPPPSIDQIISTISATNFGSSIKPRAEAEEPLRWPFIKENLPLTEWKLGDQPKTDLEVEFTPWIPGLPTVRLQFKPWALIVNLTSEDVYFGQWSSPAEDGGPEASFTIPPKTVFSPTKMSFSEGRFRFGVELGGELLLSERLRLSEEQRRTDIHHVNLDNVLPLNSFNRLDLVSQTGQQQIGYITIETCCTEKMVLLILRPTFSVINNSGVALFAQSIAISSPAQQARGAWGEEKLSSHAYALLHPFDPASSTSTTTTPIAVPLLRFITDSSPTDYAPHDPSVKYLALACPGGPWWFVQLMDFRLIFDNMDSNQGLLAASVAINLPKKGAAYTKSNTRLLEEAEFESVTLPLVIAWTSKDGQVWISLNLDPCPQLVVHNSTQFPLLYVQGSLATSSSATPQPLQQTDHFQQYLVLPPNCKGFYTLLPPKNGGTSTSTLLLTKLPQDIRDFMAAFPLSPDSSTESIHDFRTQLRSHLRKYRARKKARASLDGDLERLNSGEEEEDSLPQPCGTMLLPGSGISWSKVLHVDGEVSQYFCLGEYVDAKISIEKIGFCFYVFIENMSGIEVAAKDVRRRIGTNSPSCPAPPSASAALLADQSPTRLALVDSTLMAALSSPLRETMAPSSPPPFRLHCFLPKVVVILTEDGTAATQRRQLVCLTMEDVLLEQIPVQDERRYRALFDRSTGRFARRESYTMSLAVSNIQLDSPSCPTEHACDFPVILKQRDDYDPLNPPQIASWKQYKLFRELHCPDFAPMLSLTLTYSQSSPTHSSISSVSLTTKPFYLNVEDRLLDLVYPAILHIATLARQEFALAAALARSSSSPLLPFDPLDLDRLHLANMTPTPAPIWSLLTSFSPPLLFSSISLAPLSFWVTLRIAKPFYLAVDQSHVNVPGFSGGPLTTTSYHLGTALSTHYTSGALFQLGNPVRLIGSLELLGSPGSLVERVGSGLKDFVVYPYQGIFQGPTGFLTGLGHGMGSLAQSITSGTLTSITNFAWSVSRNIDRLTLDEEEQFLSETNRRVALAGWADGLIQGLTGFGIRLLGAVGGLAHHPIQNVISGETSPPMAVLQGVSRGVVGMVTRPIGGIVELVAMTGQGVLRSAGWTPQFKPKAEPMVEDVWSRVNSLVKYQFALVDARKTMEDDTERFLLLVDASQDDHDSDGGTGHRGGYKAVSLLLSNLNLYIIDVKEDLSISHFPLSLLSCQENSSDEDRTLLKIKTVPLKHTDESTFATERLISFVALSSSATKIVPPDDNILSTPSHHHHPFTPVQSSSATTLFPPPPPPPLSSSLRRDTFDQVVLLPSPEPSEELPFLETRSDTSTQMYTAFGGSDIAAYSSTNPLIQNANHVAVVVPSSSMETLFISRQAGAGANPRGGNDADDEKVIGSFLVSPQDKQEFQNVLASLKRNLDDVQFFRVDV